MTNEHVAGFLFTGDGSDRSGMVCKILRRSPPDRYLDGKFPTFLVQFEDGSTLKALGQSLSPWYPVD